jgi:hypothetical protein
LKLAGRTNDRLFEQDATFCLITGLTGSGISFESVNYPGHFIRRRNFELWLNRLADIEQFKRDAACERVPVLVLRGGGS